MPRHYGTLNFEELKVLTPQKTYSKTWSNMDRPKRKLNFIEPNLNTDINFISDISSLPDYTKLTPRKEKLYKKIRFQTKQNRNYRARLNRAKAYIKRSKLAIFNILPFLSILSSVAKTVVLMQLRGKRRTWNEKEKDFATAFYYKSPVGYRFLRKKGLVLPAPNTIRGWIAQNSYKTGIDEGLLDQLKLKCQGLPKNARTCVMAFDEMAIKDNLEYNKKLDIIEGFEDLGFLGRSAKKATQALVFSIRGLYGKWKMPISYFFSSNSITREKLKVLIVHNLETLFSIGYNPVAIVCDQGSNNRGAFTLLGVTKHRPFFEINNKKIFCIYDVPHLFKSIRNNWLTGDFQLDTKTLSFNVIKEIFEIDSKSTTARALPKITEKHLNPNSFEKMCCSLALQIFSNSVACVIRSCVDTGQIKADSVDTADFVSLLNQLFDALNSKILYAKNPYNKPLSNRNPLIRTTLEKGIEIFESLVKVSTSCPALNRNKIAKISRKSRPPCFDGMVQSIKAILMLFESEKQNSFILTSKLNQDYLENFFSILRQKGGWNLNPTAKAFRLSFRIQSITSLLAPSKISNCEDSISDTYYLLKSNKTTDSNANICSVTDASLQNTDKEIDLQCESESEDCCANSDFSKSVKLEDCAIRYYAGYLVKKTITKFQCSNCISELQNANQILDDPKQILILQKNYGGNLNLYLKAPSESTANMVEKSMKIFSKAFSDIKEQEFIGMKIKNKIICRNNTWLGSKTSTCYEHKVFLISHMVNTNLFKFCAWAKGNKKSFKQKIDNLKHT